MTARTPPVLFLTLLALLATGARGEDVKNWEFFERNVRPLLIEKCGECHGVDEPEGELTLTTVKGLAQGGASGPLLVKADLADSRLIVAIRYASNLKMPPEGKLAAEEIAILEKWVRDGGSLPGATIHPRPMREQGRAVFSQEDRAWWSFQSIRKPTLPKVANPPRVRTAVDRFVLHQLEQHGLTLSPDATPRTLIRRLTFDLIGLPPTPAEVDAFLADDSPDAYERLVDRLLASPQYGIRWGRHWLDIARYADTNGGGFDYVYPNAWRYRDYVVRAFNADKPYDQFLTEQLAGDLLPDTKVEDEYLDRLTATGWLTLSPKGLGMQDKEQMLLDVVDDQIDVLGRSLMGVTLACARCHDHKFDPFPTEDYYALAGIFRSTVSVIDEDKNPSYWPERSLESPSVTEARRTYKRLKSANEKAAAAVKKEAEAAVLAKARERVADYVWAAAQIRAWRKQSGAVGHWTFDGDGGAVASTTGPKGKLSNVAAGDTPLPTRTAGRLGKALRFAGKQDIVAFEPKELTALDFGETTDFSVAFWIRAAADYAPQTADTVLSVKYPGAMWFVALRPGGYNGVYLRHYDGKRTVDIKPSVNQLPQIIDRQWRHIAFTSDRDGQGVVYLDGRRVGAVSIATVSKTAPFSGAQSFSIGPSANQFRGDLDDIGLWSRLLTAQEILAIYEQAVAPDLQRNISQIEAHHRKQSQPATRFTCQDAAKQGLAPSITRRFVDLLASGEADAKSPFHSLPMEATTSREAVRQFVDGNDGSLQRLFADKKRTPFVLEGDIDSFYEPSLRQRLKELAKEGRAIAATRVADPPTAMIAFDGKPVDLKVHLAGDHRNLGRLARRGFPQILQTTDKQSGRRLAIGSGSGRLELARWLTDERHPLTARVLVNRVWQQHFGIGLVATPDNFGRLGERPSHPELLDWLANRFIEDGWTLKQLHRRIVLSSTYQQQSQSNPTDVQTGASAAPADVDSGNRLLWRMHRRRLEAEVIRDSLLSVSGQIDLRIGGTVNNWKAKMFSVDDVNSETANYDTARRSVYLPVVRGAALHEMLQLFDFGDPNAITPRREATIVAPQALFLMNSPFMLERAREFAGRLQRDSRLSDRQRIQLAYRLGLAREPTGRELERALSFIDEMEDWPLLCQALLCLNEFTYVE